MAVEIGKETIQKGRDGRLRISVQWLADTRAEAINGIPLEHEGLGFTGIRAQPLTRKNGKYVVSANYEGLTDDTSASGSTNQDQFEIIGEDREVKIEEFPYRSFLVEEFGAYTEDGRLKFPETIEREYKIGSGLGVGQATGPREIQNPMFNVTTYPVEYELAIWRMVRKKVPRSVEKIARTVVDKLPAGFAYKGDAESWYVRPLRRRRIGSMWEITVEFQEVSGLPSVLYLKEIMENKVKTGSALDTFFN